jgi:Tol biopolymer transport system component
MARRIGLLVLFVTLVLSLGACASGTDDTTESIAFTVNRDGFGEIWVMDVDGENRIQLTESSTANSDANGNHSPTWSPDGSLIAYTSSGDAAAEDPRDSEIWVMRADGSDRRRLTNDRIPDGTPAWSPDGERIAFSHSPEAGTEHAKGVIVVMDADGGSRVELTDHSETGDIVYDALPAWSPDGTRIAFARARIPRVGAPSLGIYVVAARGSEERLLIEDASDPAWSPDGHQVAFTTSRDRFGQTCFHDCGPSGEIYVAAADGTDVRRLTTSEASDHSPAWSPDGAHIAFTSDRSNPNAHQNEIYVMSADGSDVRRLTTNDVWDLEPAWR